MKMSHRIEIDLILYSQLVYLSKSLDTLKWYDKTVIRS